MQITKSKLLPLIALTVIIVSAFFCAGAMTAFASESPPVVAVAEETLSVDEVWLTGDTLHIAVTDKNSGGKQTLELKLSDYAKSSDEYVSVQATDTSGRTSNVVQFKNPYYVPADDKAETPAKSGETSGAETESAIPNGENDGGNGRPFTPDGTGSVVDNATDGDGKEFFTVKTADGNEFYLIVDRQRNAENVYFLNAVTEDDLKSLAKSGDGKTPESAIPTPSAPVVTPTTEQPTTPTPTPVPAEKSGGNNSTIILVVIAALAVGGADYYFKIVRPKKVAADDFDEGWSEPDDDEEMPLGGGESEVDER
jgi:hypothetical protein